MLFAHVVNYTTLSFFVCVLTPVSFPVSIIVKLCCPLQVGPGRCSGARENFNLALQN